MLVDDGLLRREDEALGRRRTTWPRCPCLPRSRRCSRPASIGSRPTSALSDRGIGRGYGVPRRSASELATEALGHSTTACGAGPPGPDPPGRATSATEAFRFRHLLIRDAAYRSLPKGRAPTSTSGTPAGSRTAATRGCASSRRSSGTTGTGLPLPVELRPPDTRAAALPRREGVRTAQVGRAAGARPQRPSVPASVPLLERGVSRRGKGRRSTPDPAARRARRGDDRGRSAGRSGAVVLDEAQQRAAAAGDATPS